MTPMLKTSDRTLVRYLIIQGCLSIAVGLIFGAGMLAGDVGGITSLIAYPDGLLIFLVGAVTTISPLVFATAIGLLAFESSD
jgi:hypothetical protein